MSPAPARTTDAAILAAARDLLEAGGPDAVTMAAVAEQVGVRPPSLYKHVASRSALLLAVADDAMAEIGAELASAARTGDPAADIRSMALAFRAWAQRGPNVYRHLFGRFTGDDRPSTGLAAVAVAPLLDACARLAGPAHALDAARLLTAYVHGFTNMDLSGGFGLGGDVDAAFRWGVETLTGALGDGDLARAEPRPDRRGPG
jgi:AcrR family transcriptional regulator